MTTQNPAGSKIMGASSDSSASFYVPEDLVGSIISNGRYRLNEMCGDGSMAFVYKAWDDSLETDVIVKIPKPEKIADAAFRARFHQERKLLVKLSHPHVVPSAGHGRA